MMSRGNNISYNTCKNVSILRASFKKLSAAEIVEVIRKLDLPGRVQGGEADAQVIIAATKNKSKFLVKIMSTYFPSGITYRQLSELDILYTRDRSDRHHWQAFKFTPTGSSTVYDPARIEEKISEELSSFYINCTCARSHPDAIWIRISVVDTANKRAVALSDSLSDDPSSLNAAAYSSGFQRPVFVVFPPRSQNFLLGGNLKPAHKPFVLACLQSALGAKAGPEGLQQLPLEGKDLPSLLQLLLRKDAVASIQLMTGQQVDQTPLDTSRKRKQDSASAPSLATVEDAAERKRIHIDLESAWGTGPLPALQAVKFKASGNFKGALAASTSSSSSSSSSSSTSSSGPSGSSPSFFFPIRGTFEGPNVLEGLREMARAGLLTTPLPACLVDLPSAGTNEINVLEP